MRWMLLLFLEIGGAEGDRTLTYDCQSCALPAELRPRFGLYLFVKY